MIQTSSIFEKNMHNFENNQELNKVYSLPFSQEDILQLQKIFVHCGVHIMKTTDLLQGRKIIQTIVHSLNYYHTIGCITQISGLPYFACDIITHPEFTKIATHDLLIDLENFFAVQPNFDFIWVELTETMLQKYNLQDIKNVFEMYHAQERMPVILVMYDSNL